MGNKLSIDTWLRASDYVPGFAGMQKKTEDVVKQRG